MCIYMSVYVCVCYHPNATIKVFKLSPSGFVKIDGELAYE